MRRLLCVFVGGLLPLAVHADQAVRLVGYCCDTRANELVVTYRGAWNEAGDAMLAARTRTEWNPATLVVQVDEDHYGPSKVVRARCKLRAAVYRIAFSANRQGGRIDARCGWDIGAAVEVAGGADPAPFRRDLEPSCASDTPVVTRIVFRPGVREPAVMTVAHDDFFESPPAP